MTRQLLLLCLGFGAVLGAWGDYPSGYYTKMDGKQKETLKAAAKECVQQHTMLNYTDLPNYWQYSDVYPDLVNGQKRWWDMYSDNIYLIAAGQSARTSFSANKMQREHAVPKSWWKTDEGVEYTPAYSDMWNLYPSDGPANQAKLNYPLGVCSSTTFDNGVSKVGNPVTGQGGGAGMVFEPGDEYKGDFARAFFYMASVYDDLPWKYTYMFQQENWPTLRDWAVQMLLQWSRKDPVSQKEIDRNEAVYISQGNRNPFVDFPELAEYIWGTRTMETFLLSEQGGQVTPPITGDPELTSPVDGEALDFGEVAVGQVINAPLIVNGANLTSALSVRVAGTDRAMFQATVSSIPAVEINRGNGYKLNVIYTPTAVGRHEAKLMLYDGGLPVSDNVTVELIGEAYPIPSLATLTALEPTNVEATSYTANWKASEDVVDYYVLTRIRYYEDGPESEELTSDTNSLDITDREAGITESYYVQSSRLGYLSEPSNTVTLEGNVGVSTVSAEQPLAIGVIEGGIVVLLDSRHTGFRIYTLDGMCVASRESVSGGETFMLPRGIYVVTDDQSGRPIKAIVR